MLDVIPDALPVPRPRRYRRAVMFGLFPLIALSLAVSSFASNGKDVQIAEQSMSTSVHYSSVRRSAARAASSRKMKKLTEKAVTVRESLFSRIAAARHGAAAEQPERNPAAYVGVYITAGNVGRGDFLEQTMKSVGETGGNAIIFDVKGSRVFFDGDTPMADELGLVQNSYDLDDVLKRARASGIYTMGRLVALKDAGLSGAKPSTIIKNPKTGKQIGAEFVDPENPDVLEYNRQVICTLAKSGIDEINLDYIRFSTAQFGELYAFSTEEKIRKIKVFLQMARDTIDECGPTTKLGISTYAILGWNYDINIPTLGQAIPEFAPIVDIVSPMAYPSTFSANAYYNPGKDPGPRMYYLVWRTLEGYKKLVGEENVHKLRPWIQGYFVDTQDMKDQMRAVRDAGVCGFTVWNANNNYVSTYKGMTSWEMPEGCEND